jgi:two-component system sensor histidine kinase KdpD
MNETTAALAVLMTVLAIAAVSSRRVAVIASLVAFAAYDFFFIPPIHTFAIDSQDDVVALLALLAVSLIGSHLSQQARRRAEEALALARERDAAEAARLGAETKSALIASLSHDLKTPLTALAIATENLGTGDLPDADRAEQLEIAHTELNRLRRLFDHVVEMATVEARALTPESEWVQPGEIVHAARHQAHARLADRQVTVEGDLDQPLVLIDPRLTSAALAHVLENAATYTAPATPIEISVAAAADRLAIAVRDHGAGLSPAEAGHVFDPFYRGTRAPTAPLGTGMGLAITRGLLALQDGVVTAGNHPAGGALFTIEVPVSARRAATDDAP